MEMNVKIKNNWENNKKKKRIDKIYSLFFFIIKLHIWSLVFISVKLC